MKKVIAIILGMIVILSIFTGCGSNKPAATPAAGKETKAETTAQPTDAPTLAPKTDNKTINLVYWTLFGGGDGDYMDQLISGFNKSQTEISIKNVRLEWGEYYTKLITAVSGGKGPDIGISHITKLPELVKQGIVSPLDSAASAINLDWNTINDNIMKSSIMNGQHYAVPIDTHPFIMYYNKKLLQTAGLLGADGKPIIEAGAEGYVKFLKTLKEKLPATVTPLALPNKGDDPYRLWWALYSQLGGNDVIADDLKATAIDTDKAIQAANYIKALYTDSKVIKPQIPDAYKTFQSGLAATLTTGVWATGTWETTKDFDFGAMPIPAVFGNSKTWGDSHTIILPITKDNDPIKLQAALKFAKYVSENGQIWAKAGHIPANKSILDNAEFKAMKYRSDYVSVASDVVFPKQSNKTWSKNTILIKYLDEIWLNKTSSADAFKKIDSELKTLLAK